MTTVRLATLGRIQSGEETGRVVEVLDDTTRTGGYLIFTYADIDRSPEVFDSWVENLESVEKYFEESGWEIDWLER
jgi:hypothetical protein